MSLDHAATKPHERLAAALADDMAAVNEMIRTRMASENAPRIPEVTAHLVEAGGKRVRPMMTLAAARMCGYDGPYHIHLAATVEFIHTATLLHDDVVDESDQRRGRPTANLLWDNQSSVLVGDYLFSRSFQLMVETGSLRVLDILANASATIAEGEVLQLTAIAAADADERAFGDRTIGRGRQDDGDLDRAMAILTKHGSLHATRDTALEWAARAKGALAPLPDHDLKTMLSDLADYVVARIT